ncbi:MAG: transketolase [Candidatus Nitrosomirales archaeon]|jgi:transketolase
MSKAMGEMRTGYGEALVELGAINRNVVVVGGDTTQSLKTSLFGDKYPERFFNVGISEANVVSIAAGLALSGKVPFASTYAAFIPGKCVDQIRNAIAYGNLNVKLVVSHGGLSVGPDGGSHQQLEDFAITRAIPNMQVIVPADEVATRKLVYLAAETRGPMYMRLTRPKSMLIYEKNGVDLKIGKSVTVRDGGDITVIACGIMVPEAVEASDRLKKERISCRVIDMFTLKPIDKDAIVKAAKETGAIVTAEEHNIYGGLGSAVAEVLAENLPTLMRRIGVKDTFGESGEHEELLAKYGLTANDIVRTVQELAKIKKR